MQEMYVDAEGMLRANLLHGGRGRGCENESISGWRSPKSFMILRYFLWSIVCYFYALLVMSFMFCYVLRQATFVIYHVQFLHRDSASVAPCPLSPPLDVSGKRNGYAIVSDSQITSL
jgi:hypothetical protein